MSENADSRKYNYNIVLLILVLLFISGAFEKVSRLIYSLWLLRASEFSAALAKAAHSSYYEIPEFGKAGQSGLRQKSRRADD